jgi:hypothetical protein
VEALVSDNTLGRSVVANDELWIGFHRCHTALLEAAFTAPILYANAGGGSGSKTVTVESFDYACTSVGGNFSVLADVSTRLNLSNGVLYLGVDSIGPDATGAGSVVAMDNVRITGGNAATIGAYATAGTLRIGAACDLSGAATQISLSGGYSNRGQTVVGSAGGANVAWPDLKTSDVIILTPTAAVFTGWVDSTTPGTGFQVKDAAAGTYGYFIP